MCSYGYRKEVFGENEIRKELRVDDRVAQRWNVMVLLRLRDQ